MRKFSRLAMTTAIAVAISGCFEVEDNSNDEVVAALEAQNAILEQQVTTVTTEKTPITLFGTIIDAESGELVNEASVTVKVGSEWRPAELMSGEIKIEQLPVNTDILILVNSPTGEFMDRVFYGQTTQAEQGQIAEQSVGDLRVSQGIVKTYAILDVDSSEPFAGITFKYNSAKSFSSSGQVSGLGNYTVNSTYDDVTGLYSITLPKNINFAVFASGDIDGDGIVDFTPENSQFRYGDDVYLSAAEALQLETMYVDETEAYQPVELRITLIDELGENIEGADFFASDTFLGRLETSYDETTQEYVFNYQTSSRVDLNMPSFTTSDDVTYQSGTLVLTWSSESNLTISEYGFRNNISGGVPVVDGVASIIVQPYESSTPSDTVSLVSSVIDENDNFSLKQFYASPIGLITDSITLNRNNVFTVIKGNDSDTDIVPEGTTQVGYISESVAATASLSHNDTFLTVSPDNTLTGGSYTYRVNDLVNAQTGNTFNRNWYYNFEVAEASENYGAFSINDIKIDNNNGTTNGALIVATNTAGMANTATNNTRSVELYLPKSILSLDFFEMDLISYVRNGSTTNYIRDFDIVNNDNVLVSTRHLVSLAENENIENISGYYSVGIDSQTALADGEWYKRGYVGFYAADDTSSSENTATFSYIYRVRGESTIVEGTITLPVL